MTESEIKQYYLNYLDWRLEMGQISKGKWSLQRMSLDSLKQFESKFENDELFHDKVIKINISLTRDKKIDDIFDDFN